MVNLYQSNNNYLIGVNAFVADKEDDLIQAKNTDQLKDSLPGSSILCLNPVFVEVKNSLGEWIRL